MGVAVRVLEGLGEGVTFPVMHAMLAKWAPPLELSKMATFIYTGSTLGTIVSLPLTGIICDYLGWEAAFYIFGSCGIIWFIFWAFLVYERQEQHPRISQEEKDLILFMMIRNLSLPFPKPKRNQRFLLKLFSLPCL